MKQQLSYLKRSTLVAIPIVIAQVVASLNGFMGSLFLSQLGYKVLAASAIIYSVPMAINVILVAPLFSVGALVGRAYGRGDTQEIGNLIQQAWLFSLALAAIAMLLFWDIGPILLAFHQKPELVAIVIPFFHHAVWGVPALFLITPANQFSYAVNKGHFTLYSSFTLSLAAILGGYALVLGHWGFVSHGPAGWGITYIISAWSALLTILVQLLFNPTIKQFHLFRAHMRNGWAHLKSFFSIGWPISVQVGGELFSFFVITMMVGWLDINDLAAYQVGQLYIMLLVIPVFGLTTAANVLVGQSYGRKNKQDIMSYTNSNLILSTFITLIGLIGFFIFSQELSNVFLVSDQADLPQLSRLIHELFLIGVISLFFDNFRNILTGALRGLLDTRIPMWISLGSLWLLRVPLAYVLGFTFSIGVVGIVASNIIAMFLGALLLWFRWQKAVSKLNF